MEYRHEIVQLGSRIRAVGRVGLVGRLAIGANDPEETHHNEGP